MLHVDVATLTGQPFELGPNGDVGFGAVADIRAATFDHRFEPSDAPEVRDVAAVGQAVADGQGLYQGAQYGRAGAVAPLLVRHAEAATRTLEGDERRRAFGALATVYHLVTALLSRTGETELGWVTADRAIRAAEAAGDPDLIAVGLYRLGHVMLRAGRPDEAHDVATSAAARAGITEQAGPPRASLHGALLLIAAVAELGDPSEAIRQGETVRPEGLAAELRGRRSHVHIDLAWAYGQQRNDPATVLSLLEAERVAPEVLRYNVGARELIRECLKRERRTATPGLRGLADRVGITGSG